MKENWKVGNHKSTVVSDIKQTNTNFPSPPNFRESSDDEIEYYGGYLVCESIANEKQAKFISVAPKMYASLKIIVSKFGEYSDVGKIAKEAIKDLENYET